MHFISKLALLTSGLFLTASCFADTLRCERTVTNTSKQTWTIEYATVYGHVEMSGDNCTSSHCVLLPNQSVTAEYFYDGGTIHRGPASKGSIAIIDYKGKEGVVSYYSDDSGQPDLCPQLMNYDGDVGVTLNKPDNGAINTDHDAWQ